ncbi:MAG: MaoC family dehydratase N-terminal domain-containing protein [Pseudomonadota bacterium]
MGATSEQKVEVGRITEETLERMRDRVGVEVPEPRRYHNDVVTQDGSRHFCWGYGDDNPLYCDATYASQTQWGKLITAPGFTYTMGENDAPPLTPELKNKLKGDPLSGLGAYQAEMNFEWWRPLQEGDRCYLRKSLVGTRLTQGRMGGKSIHEVRGIFQRNQHGEPVAARRGLFIANERIKDKDRSAEKKPAAKKAATLPEPYTEAEIAEIDACYEAENDTRQGAAHRFWEDVSIGDTLPRMVKGPLKLTDLILWHMGWGLQISPPGAFKLTYDIRKKIPGLFPKDHLGVPDTVQRCHWQDDWAQELGFPGPYDYGGQREVWLTHLLTNWMGDSGWLWKLSVQHRKFNFLGDTTWLHGEVTDKNVNEGRCEVVLDVWCLNRAGEKSSLGSAVVLLPSSEHGGVRLPEPPADNLSDLIQVEVEKYRKEHA